MKITEHGLATVMHCNLYYGTISREVEDAVLMNVQHLVNVLTLIFNRFLNVSLLYFFISRVLSFNLKPFQNHTKYKVQEEKQDVNIRNLND